MHIKPFLSPYTKFKSRWTNDLHIKPDTIKLIEEKLSKSFEDMCTGKKLLKRTATACDVRWRIDKWDLIKLQSFCKAKDTVNKTKRTPTDWERIFTYPKSDRGLISDIYKRKNGSICILLHNSCQLRQHHLLKMLSFFHWMVLAPLSNIK